MNEKRKFFGIAFILLLIPVFLAINIILNPEAVTAQKENQSSPILIELEQDLDQLFECYKCDGLSQTGTSNNVLAYALFTPLAVDIHGDDDVTLLVKTGSSVTAVIPELFNGEDVSVADLGNNLYRMTFSHAQVTHGYLAEHNHSTFGRIHFYESGTLWGSWNLGMNIIDVNVPSVSPQELSPDARVSPYLVNLQIPDVVPGGNWESVKQITNRFYQLFPDEFDFLNIIYAEESINNRSHLLVSNDVSGIGLSIYDYSAQYGSSGNLLGITNFPINTYFDMAENAASHEIGHQWINFALADGSPHWPLSSMAQGIMGMSIPGTNVGGYFPWILTPEGNGDYRVSYKEDLVNDRGFTDVDLYLMGLLPAAEVRPEILFQNQDQADQLYHGGLLKGPVEQFDANSIITLHGPRIPSAHDAPTSFRIASIFVTRDRFLTDEEMAFFDYMAARAETTTPLPVQAGFWVGETLPFYLATHGLGMLNGKVQEALNNSPTPTNTPVAIPTPNPPSVYDETNFLPMIHHP